MNKIFSFIISYLLVPFLIFMYAETGFAVYKYVLGTLVIGFFLCMLLFSSFAWEITRTETLDARVVAEAEQMRRKGISVLLHFLFGLAVAIAIYVYVNIFIGIVYFCTLLLLQVMRIRIKRAALK